MRGLERRKVCPCPVYWRGVGTFFLNHTRRKPRRLHASWLLMREKYDGAGVALFSYAPLSAFHPKHRTNQRIHRKLVLQEENHGPTSLVVFTGTPSDDVLFSSGSIADLL